MPNEKSRDFKAFLKAGMHEIPEKGDICVVTGVWPGSTNPLFEPAVEITLRLIEKPDKKQESSDD